MAGELPAKLLFLTDLGYSAHEGDKVRFLCCIEKASNKPGYYYIAHNYPPGVTLNEKLTVLLDVEHVLETTPHVDLQVGSWINVVGYVTRRWHVQDTSADTAMAKLKVHVQAIVAWSAGSVKLKEYEEALQARKDAGLV